MLKARDKLAPDPTMGWEVARSPLPAPCSPQLSPTRGSAELTVAKATAAPTSVYRQIAEPPL